MSVQRLPKQLQVYPLIALNLRRMQLNASASVLK